MSMPPRTTPHPSPEPPSGEAPRARAGAPPTSAEAFEGWEPRWARRLYRVVAPVYDGLRAVWSRWTRDAERELDALFAERIGPECRVLELAPGTGINVERLFRCAPGFASYLGLDVSDAMLRRARERARGDPRIRLELGDATRASELEGRFDFVVSTWLLSHLDEPAEAVRGALERLAPGGTAVFVFFTAPERGTARWPLAAAVRLFRARFVDVETIRRLPHVERITPHAGGMATLALFRRPGEAEAGGRGG